MKFKKIVPICATIFGMFGAVLAYTANNNAVAQVKADDVTYVNGSGISLYHNSFNNGYDTVVLIFDSEVFASGTNGATLKQYFGEHLLINGKTFNSYTSGISFRADIGTAKPSFNISQSSGILKMDGTDTFFLPAETVMPNGKVLQSDFAKTCINYVGGTGANSSSKFVNSWTSAGDMYLKGLSFYSYNASASTNYVMVEFDKGLSGSYSDATTILGYHFFINDKSMADINAASANSIVVNGWNQGGGAVKLFLTVKMSLFAMDGTDTVLFTKGIVSQSQYVSTNNFFARLEGSTFVSDYYEVKTDATTVTGISLYPNQASNLDWAYILFKDNISIANASIANGAYAFNDKSLLSRIVINGVTLDEMNSALAGSISFEYTQNTKLLLRIKTLASGNTNGLKLDGTDTIEFLKDFTTNNGRYLATKHTFCASSETKFALKENVEAFVTNYMHMNDEAYNGNGTGLCKTDGTYEAAKAAYVKLSDNEKALFAKHDDFAAAFARLVAWAKANGETFSNNTFAKNNVSNPSSMIGESNGNSTIIVIAAVTLFSISLCCFVICQKKKKIFK